MTSSTDRTSFYRHHVICKCWSFYNNDFFFSGNLLYILQAVRLTMVSERKFRGKKYFTPMFKFTSTHSNNSSKYDISTGHTEVILMHLWTKKCRRMLCSTFQEKKYALWSEKYGKYEKRLTYPENVKYPWAAF